MSFMSRKAQLLLRNTFCSSLDKHNTPTTDGAGSTLLYSVLVFIFQDINPDNKDNGNMVAIAYPHDQIWEVFTQSLTVLHTNNLRKSKWGRVCPLSNQSLQKNLYIKDSVIL